MKGDAPGLSKHQNKIKEALACLRRAQDLMVCAGGEEDHLIRMEMQAQAMILLRQAIELLEVTDRPQQAELEQDARLQGSKIEGPQVAD